MRHSNLCWERAFCLVQPVDHDRMYGMQSKPQKPQKPSRQHWSFFEHFIRRSSTHHRSSVSSYTCSRNRRCNFSGHFYKGGGSCARLQATEGRSISGQTPHRIGTVSKHSPQSEEWFCYDCEFPCFKQRWLFLSRRPRVVRSILWQQNPSNWKTALTWDQLSSKPCSV